MVLPQPSKLKSRVRFPYPAPTNTFKMRFIVDNPNDMIQSYWIEGKFYEQEELENIKKYLKPKLKYLDIGANIGNHAIYFDKELDAEIVYVIEPLPRAYTLLLQNIALNYCHSVNLDYIGMLVGDKRSNYKILQEPRGNLGGTSFIEDNNGTFKCIPGDDIFSKIDLDLIKIDVENMEKEVLFGLRQTIEKNKPMLYIEIRDVNYDWFKKWLIENNYVVLEVLSTYETYTNLLVSSKDKILGP